MLTRTMGMLQTCNHFSIRPLKTYTLLRKSLLTKNSARSLSGFVISKTPKLQEGTRKNVLPLSQFAFSCNIPEDQRQVLQKKFQMVQCCFYHSISNSRYRQGNPMPLLSSSNFLLGNNIDKRNFSMSWLDNLAITQAGWFRALAESRLVESLMGGLQGIHDSLNLPWWGAIIVSTILMRGVLTFPLAVYQNYILAKVENMKPEMDELVKELKRETAIAIRKFGWDEKHARIMFNRSAKKMWKDLIIKENCHPFKASLLLWVQIPLWVSMSVSFRNMASMMPHQDAAAQVLFLEMSTGGFGWIPNLTEVDHSLILPMAMGLLNLAITETPGGFKTTEICNQSLSLCQHHHHTHRSNCAFVCYPVLGNIKCLWCSTKPGSHAPRTKANVQNTLHPIGTRKPLSTSVGTDAKEVKKEK